MYDLLNKLVRLYPGTKNIRLKSTWSFRGRVSNTIWKTRKFHDRFYDQCDRCNHPIIYKSSQCKFVPVKLYIYFENLSLILMENFECIYYVYF